MSHGKISLEQHRCFIELQKKTNSLSALVEMLEAEKEGEI